MADLDPRKVMVLDNDSDTLEPLERNLRDRGFRPIVLRRAQNAVKRVKDEKPGALILELSLPDADGRALIKELKDDWDAKKVPIVVFSNYPNRLDGRNRESVEAVVGKPADWQDLLTHVERAIQKAQAS